MKRRGKKNIKLRDGERVDSGDRFKNTIRNNDQKLDRRNKLVKYEALPEYLQDNEFIRDYYRCEWPLKDIVLSLFSWHNETLNIWTHLGGFVIFVTLTVMSLTEKTTTVENLFAGVLRTMDDGQWMNMKKNGSADSFPDSCARQISNPSFLDINGDGYEVAIWPWFVFLGGAMCCLIFSTLSHLFACHSLRYNLFFWRLDYAGISFMIVCSFFCPIYYIFCNQPYWCLFYLSTITIFGILAIITLFSPALSSGRFRSFRATLFLAMGFSGLIPATHALFLHFGHPQVLVALGYEIIMGILYAIGAVFYITRFPERCKLGAFDLVGHSHQIFHMFVVAAALTHCAASLLIMDWRRGWPPCNAGVRALKSALGNEPSKNGMSSQLIPQERHHPRPLDIGTQPKVFKKGTGGLELIRSWRMKKNIFKRNVSTQLPPFHIDHRGMKFVNTFLASY